MQHTEEFLDIQRKVEEGIRASYEVPNTVLRDMPQPLVTVRTITYQHAPFIRQCIEGVLMQRTTFPVEYIIGEDFSTDGTREIVMEYAARYPDRIRVITADRNVGVRANARRTNLALRGKYCAICEGDDYWTDPLKLQKQVDFLLQNPDFVLCHHDACIVNENGVLLSTSKLPAMHKRDHTSDELQRAQLFALTLSVLYRNVLDPIENAPETLQVMNGDSFLWLRLGAHGGAHYMPEIQPAVYRAHAGGIWSSISPEQQQLARLNTYFWMGVYHARNGRFDLAKYFNHRINAMAKRPFEVNEVLKRRSYRIFTRLLSFFGVTMPR